MLRPAETPAQASLRVQIQEQKALLNSMSMVDEFASYARVERKLNKLQAELNAIGKLIKFFFTFVYMLSMSY